jgi:hypothetical protein
MQAGNSWTRKHWKFIWDEKQYDYTQSSSKCWHSEAAIYNVVHQQVTLAVPELVLVSIDKSTLTPCFLWVLYFTDSQLCGLAPKTKLHYSGPSLDRPIRIVRHFRQVLEPCHMMLKMKETSSFHYNVYVQKKTKTLFGGGWGQSVICGFSVCCRRSWNLNLAKSEGWVYCVVSSNTAWWLGRNQVTLFCNHNAYSTWYRFLEYKKLLPGLGTKKSVLMVVFNYRNMCLSAVTACHHFSWVLQTVWCQKYRIYFSAVSCLHQNTQRNFFFSSSVRRGDKKFVTVYLPIYSWYSVNTWNVDDCYVVLFWK